MPEEKTVPIDTSGEALEVTLEEDNVKKVEPNNETPIVEQTGISIVNEENTEDAPAKSVIEDETKEYSAGVKKRIDKLIIV